MQQLHAQNNSVTDVKLNSTVIYLPYILSDDSESELTMEIKEFVQRFRDLQKHTLSELERNVNSMPEIFIHSLAILSGSNKTEQTYETFLDYGLLQHIITHYGSMILQSKMHNYCSDLIKFMKKTTVQQLMEDWTHNLKCPDQFSVVKVRVNEDPSRCTLERLDVLKKQLFNKLKISYVITYFFGILIEEGNSFCALWLIPSILVSQLVKFSWQTDAGFYQQENILEFSVDDEPLYAERLNVSIFCL